MMYFFEEFPDIYCGITTKNFGDFSRNNMIDHHDACFRLLDILKFQEITISQNTHSDIVLNLNKETSVSSSDGLITDKKDRLIAVMTADCLPIFLYEPHKKVIGVVHSGRLGLKKNITEKAIIKMIEDFSIDINELIIQIGPHICPKCYELEKEILSEFDIFCQEEKGYLNMQHILLNNLLNMNIDKKQIRTINFCTACSKEDNDRIFFSHRKKEPQRFLSFIGIKN